jgi:rubrerythrin
MEKQYKAEEAALFRTLAAWFEAAAPKVEGDFAELIRRIDEDLSSGIPAANLAAGAANDRGALRALVWNEKVTRILKSLLARYQDGALPEGANVFVCTICGFVFVGDAPPELCPVCKVPGWKFEAVEGRR